MPPHVPAANSPRDDVRFSTLPERESRRHQHMPVEEGCYAHIGLRNLRALVAQRQARLQPYRGVFAFLCMATSKRVSSCSTICGMVSLGNSSKASMQQRSRLATCWLSATAPQQMALRRCSVSFNGCSPRAATCLRKRFMFAEMVDGNHELPNKPHAHFPSQPLRSGGGFVSACRPVLPSL